MSHRRAKISESNIADQRLRSEMLELRSVGTGNFGEVYQLLGAAQVLIVVSRNISNEVCRVTVSHGSIPDIQFPHGPPILGIPRATPTAPPGSRSIAN